MIVKNCQVRIKGMHCRSCEILIEEELLKIPGVDKAVVSHRRGTAEIDYKGKLDDELIENAVRSAGYELGIDEKPIISKNPKDYRDLAIAVFIVLDLYFLAKVLGLTNLSFASSNNFNSLPIVFLIGLTAGVSTCMALVGGLVLGASARFAEKHPGASPLQKFKPHLFFNLGRIISYTLFGAAIGFIGSFFQLSSSFLGLLTIGVGMVMLILGTQLTEIFPFLRNINFSLPKSISRLLGVKKRTEKEYSHRNSALAGAVTFFLPCGFTQAMQLYAISTGSPLIGALTLGIFAIGTAPGLLGIGGLTSVVKGAVAKLFFKTAGVVVVALALFNISNGFTLTGNSLGDLLGSLPPLTPNIAFSAKAGSDNGDAPKVENGIQVIRMDQNSNGYNPNVFTLKKGVPVRWVINSRTSLSCTVSLIVPKLNIRKSLNPGENVIEFTPTETGKIRFSCSMGMFGGTFNVIEDDSTVSSGSDPTTVQSTGSQATPPVTANPVANRSGQTFKFTYTQTEDINPKQIEIPVGKPVSIEITALDDGRGCMSSVTIPGLTEKIDLLEKGSTTVFDVTASRAGDYYITCGMGVPRVKIVATE